MDHSVLVLEEGEIPYASGDVSLNALLSFVVVSDYDPIAGVEWCSPLFACFQFAYGNFQ